MLFKRIWALAVVVALCAVVLAPLSDVQAAAQSYFRFVSVSGVECASNAVTATALTAEGVLAPGDVGMIEGSTYFNGAPLYPAYQIPFPFLGTNTSAAIGTFPVSSYPYTLEWRWDSLVNGELVYRSQWIVECTADGPPASSKVINTDLTLTQAPVPGCDVLIDIPSTAVGAKVTTDTLAYWAPGQPTDTLLKAGTSVRAIAREGGYYQILYVCDFLYVPVETLGPNYDYPWNGAALP